MKTTNVHKLKTYNSHNDSLSASNTVELRHFRFAQKYVELNFNATQAYLDVYGNEYKAINGFKMSRQTAQSSSSRLLLNAMVNKYLEEITNDALEETKISIRAVLARYNRWADFSIFDVIDIVETEEKNNLGESFSPPCFTQKIRIKNKSEIPKNIQSSIKSITEKNGYISISSVCQLSANNMLFKYLDLGNRAKSSKNNIVLHFDALDEQL